MPPWLIEDNSWGARAHALRVSVVAGAARSLMASVPGAYVLGFPMRLLARLGLWSTRRLVFTYQPSILPMGLAQRVALSESRFLVLFRWIS